jgi:predicted dehydrogenase
VAGVRVEAEEERCLVSVPVRLGIIGTSWWADLVLLPALSTYAPAVVVAFCGRNRERAEEMAGKYGVSTVFTDYREMYERAGQAGVVISSPDDLHYAMTMDAFDAGLHVLCEKPMARTLATSPGAPCPRSSI